MRLLKAPPPAEANPDRMRLFIGIPLAAAVTRQLTGLRSRLERPGDGLRWSNPDSWHITLQFLGTTTDAQFACVVEGLHRVVAAPVSIRLEGLGRFDRAGILFVGVETAPGLASLQQRVVRSTTPCGFKLEDRPYHPHITLARTKGRSNGIRNLKPQIEALASTAARFSAFTASEFLLYESLLGPSGSRYEVRARFPLIPE
jgi:2'-5' RNA ligase